MEMQIFNNAEFGSVRTRTDEKGNVVFCGKDVASALGYANVNDAIARHCKEKGVVKHDTLTTGGKQKLIFIDEGNLYRLITHSKLPSAERFESWVFDEVLPSIRKHGVYAVDEVLNNPDMLISALTELKAEREKRKSLETQVAVNNQIIGELKPKAAYTDKILQNKGLVTITQIAKDYGFSGSYLNEVLHALKVQYKQSGQWLLYSKYQNCGYTHSETVNIVHSDGRPDIKMTTKWTQKGRLFLYELLKKEGFVPVIER